MNSGLDKRTTAVAGIIAVAVVAYASLVTGPQLRRIAAVNAQVRAEHFELATGEASQEAMAALEKQVDTLRVESQRLASGLRSEEGFGGFLQDIASAAERHHVLPELIEPGQEESYERLAALPVSLKLRGRFMDVYGMLRAIEGLDRLSRFDRVSIQNDPERAGLVIAEISLRVYFRMDGQERGGA